MTPNSDHYANLRARLAQIGIPQPPLPRRASVGRPRTAPDTETRQLHRNKALAAYHAADPAETFARTYLIRARKHAQRQGVGFDLTLDDLYDLIKESDMWCGVLGIPLRYGHGTGPGSKHDLLTCERIDREGAFTKRNMLIVSSLARCVITRCTASQMRKLGSYATACEVAKLVRQFTDR